MLDQLGVSLDNIFKVNVFNRQPSNGLEDYTTTEPNDASRQLGPLTTNPTAFASAEAVGAVDRLRMELLACQPNVVIALGNVASWALLGRQGISSIRGAVHTSSLLGGYPLKVVPTYHPAAILRQYALRTIAIGDMEKALAEATTRELRYDHAEVWTEPSLDDLEAFGRAYLQSPHLVSLDVETRRGQLTCVGIAPSRDRAIVVPFWTGNNPNSYWPTEAAERAARRWLARIVEDGAITKVTQNGLYDIQYLIAEGMKPRGFIHDTMIAHHSLYSELPKSLEFLGATYGNWPVWKGIHRIKAEDKLKRDD